MSSARFCEDSVEALCGFCQDSVKVYEHSLRLCESLARFCEGCGQKSARILVVFYEALWKLCDDSVKVL